MSAPAPDRVPPSRGWTLITGASSGLGIEFARIAARGGRRLILTARSTEKLEALADELRDRVDVVVIPADLSKDGAAEKLWRKATDGRHIDILVNNAGLGLKRFVGEGPVGDAGRLVSVNVLAATVLMHLAAGEMRKRRGGHILNVASVAAFLPGPGMAVYHATKAYLLSLSEAATVEFADEDRGVTVTALCPGPVETGFFEAAGMPDSGPSGPIRPASARAVAQEGWDAMLAERPVVVPGFLNRVTVVLTHLLPRRIMARIAERAYRGA